MLTDYKNEVNRVCIDQCLEHRQLMYLRHTLEVLVTDGLNSHRACSCLQQRPCQCILRLLFVRRCIQSLLRLSCHLSLLTVFRYSLHVLSYRMTCLTIAAALTYVRAGRTCGMMIDRQTLDGQDCWRNTELSRKESWQLFGIELAVSR